MATVLNQSALTRQLRRAIDTARSARFEADLNAIALTRIYHSSPDCAPNTQAWHAKHVANVTQARAWKQWDIFLNSLPADVINGSKFDTSYTWPTEEQIEARVNELVA